MPVRRERIQGTGPMGTQVDGWMDGRGEMCWRRGGADERRAVQKAEQSGGWEWMGTKEAMVRGSPGKFPQPVCVYCFQFHIYHA